MSNYTLDDFLTFYRIEGFGSVMFSGKAFKDAQLLGKIENNTMELDWDGKKVEIESSRPILQNNPNGRKIWVRYNLTNEQIEEVLLSVGGDVKTMKEYKVLESPFWTATRSD